MDKENVSLPARSEKAFTLAALYDATQELLAEQKNGENEGFHELVATAVDYWTTVSKFMPDWGKVRNREIRPIELRQEKTWLLPMTLTPPRAYDETARCRATWLLGDELPDEPRLCHQERD